MRGRQRTGSNVTGLKVKCWSYLDIDEQLQEVSGRHDDGGVELDDVALVQTQIQVGSQPLRQKTTMTLFIDHRTSGRSTQMSLTPRTGHRVLARCLRRLTLWKSWTMSAGSPSSNSGTGTLMSSTCSSSRTRILSSSCRRWNCLGSSTSTCRPATPVNQPVSASSFTG